MLTDFNLLVSSSRGEEQDANSELQYLLTEIGDKHAITNHTIVSGLTVAKTDLDPTHVIENLRQLLKVSPWKFRYVLKVKPVRRVVPCTIDQIVGAVAGQLNEIRDG